MQLGFVNKGYVSKAKVSTGASTKLRYANIRSLLNEEEKQHAGKCVYRELLQHQTQKLQSRYCDITGCLGQYCDPTTKAMYQSPIEFQRLQSLNQGTIQQI